MLSLYHPPSVSILAVNFASKIRYLCCRRFRATVSSTRARTLAASKAEVRKLCNFHPALEVPKLNVKA